MKGNGANVTKASKGSIDTKIAAVMVIINTSVIKSKAYKDKKTQIRSVSAPMRAIKSPVRLPPKYSSESLSKCSKVVLRKSAPMRSLTKASK